MTATQQLDEALEANRRANAAIGDIANECANAVRAGMIRARELAMETLYTPAIRDAINAALPPLK